jgi:hypothetical protein
MLGMIPSPARAEEDDDDLYNDSVVEDIFGESVTLEDAERFAERAILCARNEDADLINEQVLSLLVRESVCHLSCDCEL